MKIIPWTQFKNIRDARELDVIMLEYETNYELFCSENALNLNTVIIKGSEDAVDFEANYKNLCNQETPSKVKLATPVNEHCMEPWGCEAGYFEPRGAEKYICNITLSERSVDGLTFTYPADIEIVPTIGNYVFQNNRSRRSWVTAVNTETRRVTFELPTLLEGAGLYTKGFYIDTPVKDWAPVMYLWGMTFTVREFLGGNLEEDPCPDFCELSVVDVNDMFLTDEVCLAVFGVPAVQAGPYLLANKWEFNGEYGHWTKYYDESWILNFNGKYTKSTDGAPGAMLPGLVLRYSFFTTELEENKAYEIYLDYSPTSMPEGAL